MSDATNHILQHVDRDDGSAIMRLKRRLYMGYLGVAAVGTLLLLALPPGGAAGVGGAVARVIVPLTLLFVVACLLSLWLRPGSVTVVEQAIYWASYPVFLGVLVVTVSFGEDALARHMALQSFALWLPIAIVWAFLAFGSGRGLVAAFGFLAVTGIALAALGTGDATIEPLALAFGTQLAVAGTVFVGALFAFSVLLERQTAAWAAAEVIAEFAARDPLTHLPNRLAFDARFDQARALARRSGRLLAVCFIDLDDFKRVNDTLGHQTGDALLRRFAERLRAAVRESDTVARIGGDEFVVLAFVHDPDQATVLADKIAAVQAAPFQLDGCDVALGCSIGVSLYPHDGADGATLLELADRAMYQAKFATRERRIAPTGERAAPLTEGADT